MADPVGVDDEWTARRAMGLTEQFGDGSGLVGALGNLLRTDGLQDLLAGFNDAGEESQVQSWMGHGANEPTEVGGVERAVGRTRLTAIAEQLGVSNDLAAGGLARIIPVVVDALTPGGDLPSGAQLDDLDLTSLLSDVDVTNLLA